MTQEMHRVTGILTAGMLFLVLAGQAGSVRAADMRYVFTAFPPLAFSADQPDPRGPGLAVEIMQRVVPKTGHRLVTQELPVKRILKYLEQGKHVDLFICADFNKRKYPRLAYGPSIMRFTTVLYQATDQPLLKDPKDLRDAVIYFHDGTRGPRSYMHASNRFIGAPFTSLPTMLANGRTSNVVEYKERADYMFGLMRDRRDYRTYEIASLTFSLCVRGGFPDAQDVVDQLHREILDLQDSGDGRALFIKYGYTGRFGADRW